MARILLPLLLLLLLPGCARDPDPQVSLEELRNRAEILARAGQRAEAAAVLHRAIRLQPHDTALYLRQGEFFEASGAARQAAGVYESARRAVPAEHPDQPELAYRLALLYALPLGRPAAARQLLHHLPPASAQHHDLLGLLACASGDGRAALQAFNTALRQPLPNDLAARLLFHAALAYQLLGDERNTYGSLYRAVGLTEHLGLMYEMRVFMDEFGRPPDYGQP